MIGFFIILSLFLFQNCYSHEPWLLTENQIRLLNSQPTPEIFSKFTLLNVLTIVLFVLGLLFWVGFNLYFPEDSSQSIAFWRYNLAILFLRIGIASSLILLSLGLLPKVGVPILQNAALLAPEFILNKDNITLSLLKWLELILGLLFLLGIFIRLASVLFLCLLITTFLMFGSSVLQYAGFYLGIIIVIFTVGSGKYAVIPNSKRNTRTIQNALLPLQILTGVNFIYSAISIKFFHPNMDIAILQMNNAFTFWLSYDYFTFLMCVVEVAIGVAYILGFRLQIIAAISLILFIFLSINLSENLFMHNFIYGILLSFILVGGKPIHTSNFANSDRRWRSSLIR